MPILLDFKESRRWVDAGGQVVPRTAEPHFLQEQFCKTRLRVRRISCTAGLRHHLYFFSHRFYPLNSSTQWNFFASNRMKSRMRGRSAHHGRCNNKSKLSKRSFPAVFLHLDPWDNCKAFYEASHFNFAKWDDVDWEMSRRAEFVDGLWRTRWSVSLHRLLHKCEFILMVNNKPHLLEFLQLYKISSGDCFHEILISSPIIKALSNK